MGIPGKPGIDGTSGVDGLDGVPGTKVSFTTENLTHYYVNNYLHLEDNLYVL